jgi:hypothetical protein
MATESRVSGTEQDVLMELKEPFFGNSYSWLKMRNGSHICRYFFRGVLVTKNVAFLKIRFPAVLDTAT